MWRIIATFNPVTGYQVRDCAPSIATTFDPFTQGRWLAFVSPRPIRKGHFVNPTKIMREFFDLVRQRVLVERVLARHDHA